MEGEAFNPSPQSSLEREGKESEDPETSERASARSSEATSKISDATDGSSGASAPAPTTTTWREAVQEKVQPLLRGAGAVRDSIGQHPYAQRGSALLSKVTSSAGRTTGSVSSSLQPVVGRAGEAVQRGRETARKVYNKEEGYEPAKVAPWAAGGLGVLLLFVLLVGWGLSDGRSKYNVDVTKIVATKLQLPNGRHVAYTEQGASKDDAKHNVLFVHGFLSSRLLGLSGVNENLLKKYGVRLVAYDRPGVGQSDAQAKRNLNTSAEDLSDIADALGFGEKFWLFAYGGGAPYAWAALHYIPTRLAGVALLGPAMNPYAKNTTTAERKAMWAGLGPTKSVFRYARHLPWFVPGKLKSSVKKVNKYMKSIKKRVNPKDRALLQTDAFAEAWERSIREAVRSGDPQPHAQDLILQARNWGFKLSDIRATPPRRSLWKRILLFWRSPQPGFSGPIHIFHGTEDKIAPVVMSEYAERSLPQVELHKLEGEGHYSWFFNCDKCHRELFKTLFGDVEGLEELDIKTEPVPEEPHTSKEPIDKKKEDEPVKSQERGPVKSEEPVNSSAEADHQAAPSQEVKPQDEL